jgi:hypothetical protein
MAVKEDILMTQDTMIPHAPEAPTSNWVAWVPMAGQDVKFECDLYHRLPTITLNGEKVNLLAVERVFFTDTNSPGVDYVDFAGYLESDEKQPDGLPKMRTFRYDFKSGEVFEWKLGGTDATTAVQEDHSC